MVNIPSSDPDFFFLKKISCCLVLKMTLQYSASIVYVFSFSTTKPPQVLARGL